MRGSHRLSLRHHHITCSPSTFITSTRHHTSHIHPHHILQKPHRSTFNGRTSTHRSRALIGGKRQTCIMCATPFACRRTQTSLARQDKQAQMLNRDRTRTRRGGSAGGKDARHRVGEGRAEGGVRDPTAQGPYGCKLDIQDTPSALAAKWAGGRSNTPSIGLQPVHRSVVNRSASG